MNFLKKTDNFFLKKKNIYYLLTLSCLLVLSSIFFSLKKHISLQKSFFKIENLEDLALNSIEQRKKIKDFLNKKTNSNKYFIDNRLENLNFLEHEANNLSNLMQHPAFSTSNHLQNRLKFITSSENKLKFAEGAVKKTALTKETEENQLYSIQIDENDLKRLLSIIEDTEIEHLKPFSDSPQLIITNFILHKKNKNVFDLNMKLLKREFFKKS